MEGENAPPICTDVLIYLFKDFCCVDAESVRTLWRDVPSVCKGWRYARANAKVKQAMVQALWKDRAKGWNDKSCAYFFDSLCLFRSLRLPFQTAVATTVAHARLRGIGWPKLPVMETLFDPVAWNELGLRVWQSPIDGANYIQAYIDRLSKCWAIVLDPPMPAYLDEVELPDLSVPRTSAKTEVWPLMQSLGTALQQSVRCMIGLDADIPEVLVHVPVDVCHVCALEKRPHKRIKIGKDTMLCKLHQRLNGLAQRAICGLDAATTAISSVWANGNGRFDVNKKMTRGDGETYYYAGEDILIPLFSFHPEEIWWPDIELECQRLCAKMVDPEEGIMRLSSSGLRCLLEDNNTLEFLQQTHMAHVMNQTAPLEDEELIPSEELYFDDDEDEESGGGEREDDESTLYSSCEEEDDSGEVSWNSSSA